MKLSKVFISLLVSVCLPVVAAPNQETALAEVKANLNKASKKLTVSFNAPAETKFNYKAPWKIELQGSLVNNAKIAPSHVVKNTHASANTFEIKVPETALSHAQGNTFKAIYFLCDEKETWCKRIKAEGAIDLQ